MAEGILPTAVPSFTSVQDDLTRDSPLQPSKFLHKLSRSLKVDVAEIDNDSAYESASDASARSSPRVRPLSLSLQASSLDIAVIPDSSQRRVFSDDICGRRLSSASLPTQVHRRSLSPASANRRAQSCGPSISTVRSPLVIGEPATVERDLVVPIAIPDPRENVHNRGSEREDAIEDLQTDGPVAVSPEDAPPNTSPSGPSSPTAWLPRQLNNVREIYVPTVEPDLILPTCPDDEEKLRYLSTNRGLLYGGGILSFLSLCTGMWLFVISSPYFAWFGVFAAALQIYMGISYWVGLVGRDWDYDGHKKILAETPLTDDICPTVDVYLPCAKEPIEILKNTYDHVLALDWPKDKLKVYVLDDGDQRAVEALARSYGFEYIVRDDRPRLKKAGNLRWAFTRTSGDFFNIYDADFCPRPDFLRETVPRMIADPKIAIVQTPQYFRTKDEQTWVEQGAGAVQELFYRVVQVNRDRWGASICVGSNALYRRDALEAVGGTAEIGFSEDVHTGFYAVDRGWKVRYIPLCLACGVCPDNPRAFFSQQMRWCMGSTTLLSNPDFWKSNLTKMQKLCYLCGMMYYSACALSIFLSPIPGPILIWVRPEYFKYYNLAFALPSILFTLIMIRLWAKASYGFNVQHCMVIQNYAYLTAIKDRILGRGLMWAASGDGKAHKNNKYRNMRILAWCWLFAWGGTLVAGIIYQIIHGLAWYNCLPVLILDFMNFYFLHRFLVLSG